MRVKFEFKEHDDPNWSKYISNNINDPDQGECLHIAVERAFKTKNVWVMESLDGYTIIKVDGKDEKCGHSIGQIRFVSYISK